RIWCGYACPQTVWTEAFVWIERKVEGSRAQQIKRDKQRWSLSKLRIKFSKHAIWILFSLWTGFTFVSYFTAYDVLASSLFRFELGGWEFFWIFFYGFATYGNAGWMREQVCMYMCPYARFQSAMFDADSLIIAYDAQRGDPRGSRKRGADKQLIGLGDCVDCMLCVQVCPTGIDIRDGLQYECIACSACIDACDEVMEKVDYPTRLIRYTTDNELHGKPSRILRPRIIIYALILIAASSFMLFNLAHRIALDLDVIRDRNSLYRENSNGLIENVYTLKLLNMDSAEHRYDLWVDGIANMKLMLDTEIIEVAGGTVSELVVRVQADEVDLTSRSNPIRFHLQAQELNHLSVIEEARFLGPGN
ncbi:MAG: cytochrome c oxidase accessory protein FixG, partial [Gammaproteobacteria bacterium]